MKITAERKAVILRNNLQPFYEVSGHRKYDSNQIDAAIAKEAEVAARANAEYFTSQEFRDDVMLELMEQGATIEQATNRTRDQFRLFNEARELGMM